MRRVWGLFALVVIVATIWEVEVDLYGSRPWRPLSQNHERELVNHKGDHPQRDSLQSGSQSRCIGGAECDQHNCCTCCSEPEHPAPFTWGWWFDSPTSLFNGLLVIVTGLLAYFSRAALIESRDASRSARMAEENTQTNFRLIQRPFVFVQEPRWELRLATPEGPIHSARFWVIWENSGNTPTNQTLSVNGLVFVQNEEEYGFGRSPPHGVTTTIGPHGKISSAPVELDGERFAKVMDGTWKLFFWGYCAYGDIFDRTIRHVVEFSFRVRYDGGIRPGTGQAFFEVYGDHNRQYDEPNRFG